LVPCSAKDQCAIRISLYKAAMPIQPRKVVVVRGICKLVEIRTDAGFLQDDVLAEMNAHRKSYTDDDVKQYKEWKA
jgi:hypothetical protein